VPNQPELAETRYACQCIYAGAGAYFSPPNKKHVKRDGTRGVPVALRSSPRPNKNENNTVWPHFMRRVQWPSKAM